MSILSDIGDRYPDSENDRHMAALMRDAREEIHGAAHHDLEDAGELNA